LLVAVVAILVLFKRQIRDQVTHLLDGLSSQLSTFSSQGG
jgi:hypothetical protein